MAGASALAFGLLEGIALAITRHFPVLRASRKVSLDVLWVAPAVDLVLFLLGGLLLLVLFRAVGPAGGAQRVRAALGVFVGVGTLAVIAAPGVLHPASAVLLAAGIGYASAKAAREREAALVKRLRRYVRWLPLVVAGVGVGVSVLTTLRERSVVRSLPPAEAGALNVLVIILDTVRRDSFTRGRERTLTPNLDRLLARGTWYDNAWAASSWSLPSHASIMTGRYPDEHHADWPTLTLATPTLADELSSRGYATLAASSNAAWVTPEYLGSGFLRFDVYQLEDVLRRTTYGSVVDRVLALVGLHYAGRGKGAPKVAEELSAFLDAYPQRPFYAYLCFMDVNRTFHHRVHNRPFWAPPARPAEVVAAYDSGVRMLDADVGAILDELDENGVLARTIVVVASDHGESFGEQAGDRAPEGHGTSLYPNQARVPLIVVDPRRVGAGGDTVFTTVSLRAIPATILDLLGHRSHGFGDRLPLPGIGDADAPGVALLSLHYEDRDIRSVVRGQWQYIAPRAGHSEELYDLRTDPAATRPVTDVGALAEARGWLVKALRNGSGARVGNGGP